MRTLQLRPGKQAGQPLLDILGARIGPELQRAPIDPLGLGERLSAVLVEAGGGAKPFLLAQRLAEQRVEVVVARVGDGRLERLGQRRAGRRRGLGENLVGGIGQQGCALVVVEDGKAGRNAGLQRKALQQPLAEGVDGLHLEATGRLDGDGEELARPLHLLCGRRPAKQRLDVSFQGRVVGGHPLAQALEYPLRHLGRRSLGVGQGQDALGRRAGQQQAQEAHGEHVRLARAGIGAHPGGCGGVRGGGLVGPRFLACGVER